MVKIQTTLPHDKERSFKQNLAEQYPTATYDVVGDIEDQPYGKGAVQIVISVPGTWDKSMKSYFDRLFAELLINLYERV